MKAITKQKLIEVLRLKEAKMWENYLENRKILTEIYGIEFEKSELSQEERRQLQRCTSKWMCINEILEDLEIEKLGVFDRDELKKAGKL